MIVFASPVEVRKMVGELAEVVEIVDADHSYRNSQKEPVYQEIAIKELIKWIKQTYREVKRYLNYSV